MTTPGYTGSVLRVDLSQGRVTSESYDEATLRKFVGGTGLGAHTLYREVSPQTPWDAPENRLFVGSGPLGGTRVHGSGTISVVACGPMTDGAVSTQANGFLGAYMRLSGADGLIIQGKAARLSYLFIHDGMAEIRDGSDLRGLDTWQTEDAIKKELGAGEHDMSVFSIGPAGENQVRFAALVGDRGHVAGHNGVGAVLGAKNLKAIAAARGKSTVPVHDAARLSAASGRMFEAIKADPVWSQVYHYGMLRGPVEGSAAKTSLVKNYTTNLWDPGQEVLDTFTGPYIRQHFQPKPHPCWACPMHHCHILTIPDGPYKGYVGEEPEAESLSAWGSLVGNPDVAAMIMLSNEVDRLGMDTNEAGWVVAMALEAYEKGLLTLQDTDGLELRWGNVAAIRGLLYKIARRQGWGNTLAEGTRLASERLGGQWREMAIFTAKGNSPRSHDHRIRWLEMFDTVVSSTGTLECDVAVRANQLGIPAIQENFDGEQVSSFIARSKGSFQFLDSLGTCKFINRTVPPLLTEMLNASTGWDFTWDEAMTVGRRAVNLFRAFNHRRGIDAAAEFPSPRYGSTPVDGAARGKSIGPHLQAMKENHHKLMGWDPTTGKPLPDTLRGLGLEEVARDLWDR